MEVLVALVAGFVGAAVVYALTRGREIAAGSAFERAPAAHNGIARRVLEVMRPGAVVIDESDDVIVANSAARTMGILRGGRIAVDELVQLAREVRQDGDQRHAQVDLPRGRLGHEPIAVTAHVVLLDEDGHVALLLEDETESRRLEAVRRDFVANVSHELKTPVGALALLAEAVQDAADDPASVRRFAERMQHESSRLGKLIKKLIELSRLQGAAPLPSPVTVSVDHVVAEAIDRMRLAADRADISIVSGGEHGLFVRGDESQLITALVNLVDNAIGYSPPGTRVAIGIRRREPEVAPDHAPGYVEISVSDQGMGIAEGDLERVFERFYRADPARSRATGGTGLGLAIVKHIATNHGGSVSVWSVAGSGSTFTLRVPAATLVPQRLFASTLSDHDLTGDRHDEIVSRNRDQRSVKRTLADQPSAETTRKPGHASDRSQ